MGSLVRGRGSSGSGGGGGGGGGGGDEAVKTTTGTRVESVVAEEACALLSSEQYGYVDVRMWEDFDKGHVADARNVPYYLSVTPHGKEKNPDFVDQVAALYAKDDCFIVGCRSGVRSKLATSDLVNAGFSKVKNLEGGYLSLLRYANPQQP